MARFITVTVNYEAMILNTDSVERVGKRSRGAWLRMKDGSTYDISETVEELQDMLCYEEVPNE